ncbi:MAG: D-2-hydroxyacid dehydrogenase [Pseudomonadota bacterium]
MALAADGKARLESLFHPAPVTFVDRRDKAGLKRALAGHDVAVVSGNPPSLLLEAPSLRWIHCDQAGLERFATPDLFKTDLMVTSAAGRSAVALAEHVLFFMLALSYRSRTLDRLQRRRVWGFQGQRDLRGLAGRRVLIIGFGHSGQEIAARCLSFGMTVTAFRRKNRPSPIDGVVGRSIEAGDRLDGLLPEADFLVLAASLNQASHRMVGADEIGKLPRGAHLINVARARLVDTEAMISALRSGHLAGAGIDVAEREPLAPWSRLWGAPNLILTPHFTPQGPDRTDRSLDILAENVRRYRAGEDLLNRLSPEDAFDQPHPKLATPLAAAAKIWRFVARPGRMPEPD